MIGLVLLVLLAGTPPPKVPKSVRPPTQAEDEAAAIRIWESKEVKEMAVAFDAGAPRPPFRWKLLNIIRETPIDGVQLVNDVPVRLHSVVVKGRLSEVVEELYGHFVRSGLYMEPIDRQDQLLRQVQVTAYDDQRSLSYTAMVDALPDGTCVVVLGEANIGESIRARIARRAKQSPEPVDFAPLMPQAIGPTRVSLEGMKTLSFQVKASEDAARKFYREQLAKLGYSPAEGDLFQKKNEEIQLSLRRDKELLTVLLTSRIRAEDRLIERP